MLTDTQIRNLKPAEKAKKYTDGGLYLYIAKTGSKLWCMASHFNDKEKLLSSGEYPIISLKDTRIKRNEAKKRSFTPSPETKHTFSLTKQETV